MVSCWVVMVVPVGELMMVTACFHTHLHANGYGVPLYIFYTVAVQSGIWQPSVCLLFYAIATVFQLYHSSNMMY